MKIRILVPIVAVCLAAYSGSALAQEESLERARAAFDTAQTLFQNQEFEQAAEKFKEAYRERQFGQFLYNIGACYEKGKDYQQALDYYQKYLASDPPEDDARRASARIEALSKALTLVDPSTEIGNLAEIEIQGVVVITSEPSDAIIYLDSTDNPPFARTPWNGSLTGGHTIYVEKKGHKLGFQKAELQPDKFYHFGFFLGEQEYLSYLDVSSNVPGASVYMDDKSIGPVGKTPWKNEVKPGKHKLWITKEGYSEYSVEIELVAGEPKSVRADLVGSEVGYLNVQGAGVEDVSVFVNGGLLCERGPCLKGLAPGRHSVSIRRSGYKNYDLSVEVQSKTEITMRPALAEKPSRFDAVVAYGLSAAFLAGGYYLGSKSRDLEDELKNEIAAGNPPPDANDPRFGWGVSTGKTYAVAANVSYALSGASLLVAGYYTFRDKGRPSTSSVNVRAISFVPEFSPTSSGISVAGRF